MASQHRPRSALVQFYALLVLLVAVPAPAWAICPAPLCGPLTQVGSNSDPVVTAYDTLQITEGRIYANGFPQFLGDNVGSNFYDLALSLYLIYYRTGDTYWRDHARTVARAWQLDPLNQDIPAYLAGNYSLTVPPGRSMATMGLALYYLDTGDTTARSVVNNQARVAEIYTSVFNGINSGDTREAAYALMAMLAATVLGDNHSTSALTSLNSFLSAQQPSGCWQQTELDLVPAGPFVINYMDGLAMEAMILYDRAIGDPRILPAIQTCINWTWSTQWVATVPGSSPTFGAFQYASITSGSVNTNPYSNLVGMLLPAWGYVYAKTGNTTYLTQGNLILQSMVTGAEQPAIAGAGIYEVKQFDQMFRSSPYYLGYITSSGTLRAPFALTVR